MRLTDTSQADAISVKNDTYAFVAKSTWAERLMREVAYMFTAMFYNRTHRLTCICDEKHFKEMKMYNNRNEFGIYGYSSSITETSAVRRIFILGLQDDVETQVEHSLYKIQ